MSSEAAAYFPDALASTADRQTSVCSNEEQSPLETRAIAPRATAQSSEDADEDLLDQVSRGVREALGLLFRRHARSIRNVAQRILRDEAEADDLLQDIFLFTVWLRKADEGALGPLLVETTILLSARSGADAGKALRAAAEAYKVDTDAVSLKVKQEFAAKEKAKKTAKDGTKASPKPKRAA